MAHMPATRPPRSGWDVKADFGAVGDGVTDDTDAIQEALDQGGYLVFPEGTYKVTTTLNGNSNTTLLGYGLAEIALITTSNVDVLLFEEAENVSIIGLNIDGRKATKTSAVNTGRGIHFNQVANGLIADCYIHDTYEHGIRCGGDATHDSGDTTVIVRNNTCEDCGNTANDRGWGIWCFWRVLDSVIQGNRVINCQAGLISGDDTSSDATPDKECFRIVIANNVCRGTHEDSAYGRGIMIEGARDFAVVGNTVEDCDRGVLVNDGQGGVETGQASVSGNHIRARHIGIDLQDCRDIVVAGNEVEITGAELAADEVRHAAIKIEQGTAGAACERVLVTGNRVRSDRAGISTRMVAGYVPSGADFADIVISDNHVTYTGSDPADSTQHVGIQIVSPGTTSGAVVVGIDRVTIRGNVVRGFSDGIYADDNCTGVVIQDNVVENSSDIGIRVGPQGAVIKDNILRDNTTASFLFDAAARHADTIVSGNVSTDGTFVSGASTDVTFYWPLTDGDKGDVTVEDNGATFTVTAGGGGLSNGDAGDIIVASGGASLTIDNDAVTFAKMQNIATDRLLGRDTAATGNVEEIAVSGGLEFTGAGSIQRGALTGDVTASAGSAATTIANEAVTTAKIDDEAVTTAKIDDAAVTLAKMADVATARILGRVTSGTGVPEAMTGTQATTLLDAFTSSLKGLAPASGGGTTNFLRADGTWADPNETALPGLQQQVGVVSYFYPGAHWDTVHAKGTLVGFTIMNPSSGPGYGTTFESGGSVHTDYTAQVAETQAEGIPVLHYLSQNYRDNASEHGGDQYAGTVSGTYQFSVDAGTDVVTTTSAHGRAATVVFGPVQVKAWTIAGNTLPAGLAPSTDYWARSLGTSTLTLHPTSGDASANTNIIDITDTGTGGGYYMGLSKSLANIANLEDEVDLVLARYPDIDGFFFDETRVTDNADSISYVQTIYDYIKAIDADLIVVQNGYQPPESFVTYADTFMRYENTAANYLAYTAPAWMAAYDESKWWDCAHTVSAGDEDLIVDHSRTNGAKYVSFHSSSFSSIPATWGDGVDYMEEQNGTPVSDEAPSYGGMYWSVPAATTLAAATAAKAAGVTAGGSMANFTHVANNRLKYTGSETDVFRVEVNVSLSAAGACELQIPLRKNGSTVANLVLDIPDTDKHLASLVWLVSLSTNDYLELYLQTDTGDDVTVQGGTMVATRAGG